MASKIHRLGVGGTLGVLTATVGALIAASPAAAITPIVVNTTRDGSVPGKTTLRQAFDRANTSSSEVDIILAARGTYTLSVCGEPGDQSNNTGALTFYGSETLTISGNDNTLRQTCQSNRVLNDLGTSLMNINDLTVSGGDAVNQPGGGIWDQGAGELDLKNDVFTGNHSDAAGGGVAASGKTVITNSTFTLNSASELGGALASLGPVVLVKSTITGNTAPAAPKGVPPIGGIAASEGLTMLYSTVQDNTSQNINVQSGGLVSFASVVGLPRGGRGVSCSIAGGTRSLGYNFSNDASCGFGKGKGDRSPGGNPKLRPETLSGGRLEIVPGPGSPLINAIPRAACFPAAARALTPVWAPLTTDQFGTKRPQGKGCDIGAVEVLVAPVARFTYSPSHPKAGQRVHFNGGHSYERYGSIVSYAWSFGDGSRKASGRTVNHVFKRAGTYVVRLTVKDAQGHKKTIAKRVRIAR